MERVIPSPTPQDLAEIRTEVTDMAIKSGATAESIEIQIEIDSQTSKVRAIATGSTEIQTQDLAKKATMEEATKIAADSMRVELNQVTCIVQNENFYVFGSQKGRKQEIRVVDKKGIIKIQRRDGSAVKSTTGGVRSVVDEMWEELSGYKSDIKITPDFYLCIGAKVIDYEGMSGLDQLHMVMDSELMSRASGDS